jgi:uncharacterized protein (DUF1810 family)
MTRTPHRHNPRDLGLPPCPPAERVVRGAVERHHGRVTNPGELSRFVSAQDGGDTYAAALSELREGQKRTHWMWFVFPQIAGLGRSQTAQRYAISGLDEARAYLAHPVLGPRLVECAHALTTLPTSDPVEVLGPVDAQKLRSSMTLFARAAEAAPAGETFRAVLDQYFAGKDDEATTRLL